MRYQHKDKKIPKRSVFCCHTISRLKILAPHVSADFLFLRCLKALKIRLIKFGFVTCMLWLIICRGSRMNPSLSTIFSSVFYDVPSQWRFTRSLVPIWARRRLSAVAVAKLKKSLPPSSANSNGIILRQPFSKPTKMSDTKVIPIAKHFTVSKNDEFWRSPQASFPYCNNITIELSLQSIICIKFNWTIKVNY